MNHVHVNGLSNSTQQSLHEKGNEHRRLKPPVDATVASTQLAAWVGGTGKPLSELAEGFGGLANLSNWKNGKSRPSAPSRALIQRLTGILPSAWDEPLASPGAASPDAGTETAHVSRAEFDALRANVTEALTLIRDLHAGLCPLYVSTIAPK